MSVTHATDVAPIDSATVVLLRDTPHGFEVLLVKRHGLSDVLGGAYVFPGGKLDDEDVDLVGRLDQSPIVLQRALNEPALGEEQAAALYVAAIREAFEEVGILFASIDGPSVRDACNRLRRGHATAKVLNGLDVPLGASALAPWSRWITPFGSVRMRKRFDARFFVAVIPCDQEAVHDEHEAVESVWVSPRAGLHMYWERQIELAPPQIMTLAHLAHYENAAAVLAEARKRTPPLVQPEISQENGVQILSFPGDDRHSVAIRAIPGPKRLCWRNDRFEPADGYATLFL
jgi:8-oxo-dGTP pyrophosphatase MutT (NUDIX family)